MYTNIDDHAEGDVHLFDEVDDVIVDKKVKHLKQIPREEKFNPDGIKNDADGVFKDQNGNIIPFEDELPE